MAVPITALKDLRGIDREVRKLLGVVLDADGWRVVRTRGSHFQAYPPRPSGGRGERGKLVTVHGTGSDPRAINNLRADLRRAGLEC